MVCGSSKTLGGSSVKTLDLCAVKQKKCDITIPFFSYQFDAILTIFAKSQYVFDVDKSAIPL